MSFGKFGSRPRGVNNPIYWVNRYRQDERSRGSQLRQDERSRGSQLRQNEKHRIHQQIAVDKFNERWHRLIDIHKKIITICLEPLNGKYVKESIALELIGFTKKAVELRKSINTSLAIDDAYILMVSELTKYATYIKEIALLASEVCTELEIYDDIKNARYDASSKSILLNESVVYFIG